MKRIRSFGLLFLFLASSCAPVTSVPTRSPLQPTQSGIATLAISATPEIQATVSPTVGVIPTVAFTSSPPAECKVVPILPATDAMAENKVPEITAEDWAYGTATPKITILSYCSYQKPACQALALNLAELQHKYQKDIRVVSRLYPQPEVDDKSLLAAQAAEAAGLQNRFWEMNNLLYTRQSDWVQLPVEEFSSWLKEETTPLGISWSRLESDMKGDLVSGKIE